MCWKSWREDGRATVSVTGHVVEKHRTERRFLGRSGSSWVVVDYRVSGRVYRRDFGAVNLPHLQVGNDVVVKYDPGDPLVATIAGSRPKVLEGIVVALAVPTMLVLAIRYRWRRDPHDPSVR